MTISEILENEFAQVSFQTGEHLAMPIVLALLILAIIIYLARKKIRDRWLNYKTTRSLNRLGLKQVANVRWPDGLGHYFTIDRLILRPDGISLLVYKRFPGKIFCADNINDWTQMLGKRSYRFKNPFYDLDYQVKLVAASIPGVPVNGYLFFDHLAEFPKGHPERVIHLDKVPEELQRGDRKEAGKSIISAWKKLLATAKK